MVSSASSISLLRALDYAVPVKVVIPKASSFTVDGLEIKDNGNGNYFISAGERYWTLESKILLNTTQIFDVCNIAARFAPESSKVSLQPDTHNAGDVFVGMVMSYDTERIPVNLISGDIGCGLTVLPFIKDLKDRSPMKTTEEFSSVLYKIRVNLKRGMLAENGQSFSEYTKDASEFYGESELVEWLNEMDYVLSSIGISFINKEDSDERRQEVLQYIGCFAQSLGSSGNHFLEVSEDEWHEQWIVIHSGSRALGAKVYSAVSGACRYITGGYDVATGKLATYYARAYDALNKFAKLNRVICGIAVLKSLGYIHSASELRQCIQESTLFKDAIDKCGEDRESMFSLVGGLTHNGIKAFVNHATKQVLYVLCKGSVAISKRASASIVALRPGRDGCYVYTLQSTACQWKETSISQALTLGFDVVYETDGVVYSGHGAGRSQSTTKTAQQSTFDDVVNFYDEEGIFGNVAPGVLGDNPRFAYKDVETIMKELPLDLACTKSQLRTLVTFKEGISYDTKIIKMCAEYIKSVWSNLPPHRKLWMDLNLCRKHLDDEEFKTMQTEQQKAS